MGSTAVTGHQAILALGILAAALLLAPGGGPLPRARPERRRTIDPAMRRTLVTAAGVAAAGVLLSLPWWAVSVAAGLAVPAVRLLPARHRPPDVGEMRGLAGTFDLLATGLDAGLPTGRAIAAVLDAVRAADRPAVRHEPSSRAGPTGPPDPIRMAAPASAVDAALAALDEVVALLALGADPTAAWRPAAGIPELAALAAAAQRSAIGGVRLADAARDAAADLRERCRRAGERSAARAGVAMTAPLATCFLPAFVCLGLAPVIVSMVSSMHIW